MSLVLRKGAAAGASDDEDERPTNYGSDYLSLRHRVVQEHFPESYGVDDFMARVEIMLCQQGFSGKSSIAVLNLCRDEICNSLKRRVETIFGDAFNIHGLGAVLTCGKTGMGAGLSHSPLVNPNGKEKYIFFSFPHIAINAAGEPGVISRHGRHDSHACGALLKALGDLKAEPNFAKKKVEDEEEHEMLDPEYSILRHRLQQHMAGKKIKGPELDLVKVTRIAEQAITQDLETLIRHSVNHSKADYAVVTGIQIHNWANTYGDDEPNLEFVAPGSIYTVINGKKTELDPESVTGLTPRMIRILYNSERASGHNELPTGPCVHNHGAGVSPAMIAAENQSKKRRMIGH